MSCGLEILGLLGSYWFCFRIGFFVLGMGFVLGFTLAEGLGVPPCKSSGSGYILRKIIDFGEYSHKNPPPCASIFPHHTHR